MAYTTTQLITDAYYLSGIISRNFQTVSPGQLSDGLRLLNNFIALKSAKTRFIPYYSEYNFDLDTEEEKYFIPNLLEIETFVFYDGDGNQLRYATSKLPRRQYFGSTRVQNVNSLPITWHPERRKGGTDLYIYFVPDQAYAATAWGKFALSSVSEGQDLELTLDKFYIVYLLYGLGTYICQYNQRPIPADTKEQFVEIEKDMKDISPADLTMSKISSLSARTNLSWADINLGNLWRPSW